MISHHRPKRSLALAVASDMMMRVGERERENEAPKCFISYIYIYFTKKKRVPKR